MSAMPPSEARKMRQNAALANKPLGSLAQRWEDLHNCAAQLAKVAAISPEKFDGELKAFPAMFGEASEWQRELAWQGIEDIDAMMSPGLTALQMLTERGQDASAPALILWREFHHARQSVLGLVRPH